jgi:hypothetical protein
MITRIRGVCRISVDMSPFNDFSKIVSMITMFIHYPNVISRTMKWREKLESRAITTTHSSINQSLTQFSAYLVISFVLNFSLVAIGKLPAQIPRGFSLGATASNRMRRRLGNAHHNTGLPARVWLCVLRCDGRNLRPSTSWTESVRLAIGRAGKWGQITDPG